MVTHEFLESDPLAPSVEILRQGKLLLVVVLHPLLCFVQQLQLFFGAKLLKSNYVLRSVTLNLHELAQVTLLLIQVPDLFSDWALLIHFLK